MRPGKPNLAYRKPPGSSPGRSGAAAPAAAGIVADPSEYATASNQIHQEERANVRGLKDRVTSGVYGEVVVEPERRREARA